MNNNYEDMFNLKIDRLEDNMSKYPVMEKACKEIGKGISDYEKITNLDNLQDLKLNPENIINVLTAMNRSCGKNILNTEAYIASVSRKPSVSELIDELSSEITIDNDINIDEDMVCSYILIRYIMREYFSDMIENVVVSSSNTTTTNDISNGETTVWDKLDSPTPETITKKMVWYGNSNEGKDMIPLLRQFIKKAGMKINNDISDEDMSNILYAVINSDDRIIDKLSDVIEKIILDNFDLLEGKSEKEILNWLYTSNDVLTEISNSSNMDDRVRSGLFAMMKMILGNIDLDSMNPQPEPVQKPVVQKPVEQPKPIVQPKPVQVKPSMTTSVSKNNTEPKPLLIKVKDSNTTVPTQKTSQLVQEENPERMGLRHRKFFRYESK